MSENAYNIGRLGIHKKEREVEDCIYALYLLLYHSLSYLVAAGAVDLLSLEPVLEVLDLLAVLPVVVLVSLVVLLSPGDEVALPSALSAFLPSPFFSLATALVLL